MKKIIILYSTGGMGHKKAALALVEAFEKKGDQVSVKNIDTLEYANKFCRFLYNDWYVFMMTKGKVLWGWLYKFSDIKLIGRILLKFREYFDIKSLPGLDRMLCEERPDAIITTHFILPAMAKTLKRKESFRSKLFVVVTDYGPHSFWFSEHIDKYFVGADSMVPMLEARGIPAARITPSGIPAVGSFSGDFDLNALRKTYGLEEGKKTVFMLSGGFGVGPMEEILESLRSVKTDIQVITVCGYNKQSYESINKMKGGLNYPVILFGFSDKIAELMAVSDIMITKAGGISVTEAMNMSLPMILIDSIPGQESWNEELLVSNNAAKKAGSLKDIAGLVNQVLLSDDAYEALKEGISSIRKPNAARDIVETVLADIGG